jgi:hypothetical protein
MCGKVKPTIPKVTFEHQGQIAQILLLRVNRIMIEVTP